jgi:hypothetical protein
MENDKELREKFSKILGAPNKKKGMYDYVDERVTYSWEEIFTEIGKLIERSEKPPVEKWIPRYDIPVRNEFPKPEPHYHGTMPCYNNPCTWH